MKVLVTGFDPFGGEKLNPALEAIKSLPSEIQGAEVRWLEVPTVFYKSAKILEEEIRIYQPDIVLCIGQAGGRKGLTPERVAINQDDARIQDNEGNQPIDRPIQLDGPPAYFSSLPIKAMVQAIKEEGLPASVSNTAGTFVCNHLMYQVLYLVEKEFPTIKAGFMHIPYMMEQVIDKPNTPAMDLVDIVRGIEAAIRATIEYGDQDLKFVCNHLMYQVLYLVEKEFPTIKAGFMHIPYMMEQVIDKPNTPAMDLVDIVRGIEAAIRATIEYGDQDLKLVGGETH